MGILQIITLKKISFVIFVLLSVQIFAQSTVGYLTYQYAPAVFNPAYTAAVGENRLSFVFSREILDTDKDPLTYHVNYTQQLKEKMSAGISISNTKFNIENTLTLALDFGYRLQLNRDNNLFFGAKLGVENFSNRLSELSVGNDPMFDGKDTNLWNAVLGFGIRLQNDNYFIGFSVPNLLADKKTETVKGKTKKVQDSRHSLYLNAGYHFLRGKKLTISPQIFMSYQAIYKKPFVLETALSTDFNENWKFTLGYGTQNKLFTSIGFRFSSWGRLAYAYDYFLSGFSSINQSTHGFMLQTTF